MPIDKYKIPILPRKLRIVYGSAIILTAVLFVFCASCLPFFFESSSILYKFGFEKAALRGGKILGLITGCLIVFQVILIARIKVLDRIFALNNLMSFHRISGILILSLAAIHPVLILASEKMWFIPVKMRYWPEFAGVFLALLIFGLVIVALFRKNFRVPFHWWRRLHQWGAYAVLLMLFIHVLFVSDTFSQDLPQTGVLLLAGICAALFLWVGLKRLGIGRYRFAVISVLPAGKDAWCIRLKPNSGTDFKYAPGQFGFFSFKSEKVSSEEHPFTLSSSPKQSDHIEIIVRESGDWTSRIMKLHPGDGCRVEGPFGLFTNLAHEGENDLVMVAGGIGITPILSMLRYRMEIGNPSENDVKITLIWSNKTRDHLIFSQDFDDMATRLKQFKIIHVFTRVPGAKNQRIDQSGLKQLLANPTPNAHIYICGPPLMMKDMINAFKKQGIGSSHLHVEQFKL